MGRIYLLDCTLRDGGYVNNWMFGRNRITSILQRLVESNVEYIECGYLTEKNGFSADSTKFSNFDAVRSVLPKQKENQHYSVMIDFGTYDIEHLPGAVADSPLVRVCFHKKDAVDALSFCQKLIGKGYGVLIQPMVSISYSDAEFLQVIDKVNQMNPLGFYIVDSFGSMELPDFRRLLFLADHNLSQNILLGYHAHNNLQQAYENAKYMVDVELQHDVLLDACVYGMGRGAGNLNIELFAGYLNLHHGKNYNIDAFLEILDKYLMVFFSEKYWGYSLPFYLSARYNCHPNYASYFAEKNTLSYESFGKLLAALPDDVKLSFSENEAERYYSEFVRKNIDDQEAIRNLKVAFENKNILILAPGKSLKTEKDKIDAYIESHDCTIIAAGVAPQEFPCDYLFCCNEKRMDLICFSDAYQIIMTSNIDIDRQKTICINYASCLTGSSLISANPVLMIIQMLIRMGIGNVAVAGFDGYRLLAADNYYDPQLAMGSSNLTKIERNALITEAIRELSNRIAIDFITQSLYTVR